MKSVFIVTESGMKQAVSLVGESRSGWEVSALRLRPKWAMQGPCTWGGRQQCASGEL